VFLLDSDVLIDILRSYEPALQWVDSVGDDELIVAGFAAMELIQGCRNKSEQHRVENALHRFGIVWPESQTCDRAFELLARCHLKDGIGIIDALVAQMAIDFSVPLVTYNAKHYSCAGSLQTTQPYPRP
jgi:hypothetical protein